MSYTDAQIRSIASDLLREVWINRRSLGIDSDDPFEVLHVAPRAAAEGILLLQIVEQPVLLPTGSDLSGNIEVAGMLCRPEHTIYLAKNFKTISRRFTLAHEIGHFKLHPGLALHRDRPLETIARSRDRRTRVECEADLFAAEFLIPEKQLRPVFHACFQDPIEFSVANSTLIYRLVVGTGRSRIEVERAMVDPLSTAIMVATAGSFGLRPFESLAARFAVSPTAMAIQLLDLGLVKPALAIA